MKVRDISHSRTGDKGDYSVISVICYTDEGYEIIKEKLTCEKVKEKYSEICLGEVTRFEVPKVKAFIYQLEHALGGGVTRSLGQDGHGKSLSFVMQDIDLD